ncbi:MAG: HU family DNA-binding protein [Bacteroidota bacterium]
MSILYKSVPKGQPGVVGGGTIKYYAGIVRQQPINMRRFATEIADRSTLTTTDVFAVLESFVERMQYHMEDGRIIRLGDFGSFSPSLSSKAEDLPGEVDEYTISKIKVNFRPSKELRSRLEKLKFHKLGTATDASEVIDP